ncbi:glycosyltransferase [Mucisphaera sp.]|uniref:glycosyltransferase n=1 Tax=Mucisphaera sp. TaxID=2913024 RepID=UPI003D14C5D5
MSDTRPILVHVVHRLYRAGAELLVADLAHRAAERYRVVLVCLDEVGPLGEELRAEGFEVICLDRRPGLDFGVVQQMARVYRRLQPAVVHTHQYTPFFYASAARVGVLGRGPRILFTEHGRHYPDRRKLKRVVANRLLLGADDRVTAVGEFVRRALVKNEGLAGSRVTVVHNGIDVAGFAKPERGRADVRRSLEASLGIDREAPLIVQVARFHPVKDHLTAIRAMAGVRQRHPDAVLLLVGDGDERASIELAVAEHGLEGAVCLAGVRSDVADLLLAADVFLLTSVSEGISLTLLEAMAAGLPVVATAVGGNPEVVEQGETGWLSGRGHAEGLAEGISRLLGDEGMRARFGAAGRERVAAKFDRERMHRAYLGLYDELSGGTRGLRLAG